jgi:DNA-binding response OmpR family regulator
VHYQLLLVEDEALGSESLSVSLADNKRTITLAHTPQHVQTKIVTRWPDLVILNLTRGSLNFVEIDRAITRANLDIPRLAVVNDPPPDEIKANAFVYPPYTREDLVEQITQTVKPNRFLRMGNFTLDTYKKMLLRTNEARHLTPKLFDLLILLLKHEGQIVYRKTIMQEVWQTDYMGDTRTLDVHIRWLREHIEDNPSRPRHLLTVRGAGYRFIANPEL